MDEALIALGFEELQAAYLMAFDDGDGVVFVVRDGAEAAGFALDDEDIDLAARWSGAGGDGCARDDHCPVNRQARRER